MRRRWRNARRPRPGSFISGPRRVRGLLQLRCQNVLARSAPAPVLGPPGTTARGPAVGEAHLVAVLSSVPDQGAGGGQARVVAQDARRVVGQARGGRTPPGPRRSRPVQRFPVRSVPRVPARARAPSAQRARPGPGGPGSPAVPRSARRVEHLVLRQRREHRALPGETPPHLRRERQGQPHPRQVQLPGRRDGGRPGRDRRPVHRQRTAEPQQGKQFLEPVRAGQADRARARPSGQPQRTPSRHRPQHPARRRRQCAQEPRRVRRNEPHTRIGPEAIACTSAKPRSQRPGSGTLRSTIVPSSVATSNASGPTRRRNGSAPRTRARASRSGAFTSTFVVPRANLSPSSASSSTSRRAYTRRTPRRTRTAAAPRHR